MQLSSEMGTIWISKKHTKKEHAELESQALLCTAVNALVAAAAWLLADSASWLSSSGRVATSCKLVKAGAFCMFGCLGQSNLSPTLWKSHNRTTSNNCWIQKMGKTGVTAKMLRILNCPSLRESSGRDSQLQPPLHIRGASSCIHAAELWKAAHAVNVLFCI